MSSKYIYMIAGISSTRIFFLFLLSLVAPSFQGIANVTQVSPLTKARSTLPSNITLVTSFTQEHPSRQTRSIGNTTHSVSKQTHHVSSASPTSEIHIANTTGSVQTVTSSPYNVTEVTITHSSRRPSTNHVPQKATTVTLVPGATNVTTPYPVTTNQSHFTRENTNVTIPSMTFTTPNSSDSENSSVPVTSTHRSTTVVTQSASTTSILTPTTTNQISPSRPRFANPLTVTQYLDINGNFNPRLNDKDDVLRLNYTKIMQTFLLKHYQLSVNRLRNITVLSFREGSIQVEYELVIDRPTGNSSAMGIVNGLRTAVNSWTDKQPVILIGDININKTLELSLPKLKDLQRKLQEPCMGVADACSISELCMFDSKGDYYCRHKCSDFDCGRHGVCAVNINGKPICSCISDNDFIYHGPKCQQKRSKHTTQPETGSNTVAIAVGVSVPVIVILGIVVIVLFLRRRKNNDKVDTISTSNLDIENYKIENIPVTGFQHRNQQQLGYQPSNLRKPIQRLSTGSHQSNLSGAEITMDQMPSFDNMDPPEHRTISDYMDDH